MEAKMGMYKHIREFWKKPKGDLRAVQKQRIFEWRREPVTVRIDRPTRLDRARSLGYRAKQGILIVRQRLIRGGRQRPQIRKGRRSKHFGRKKIVNKSYQTIAEERAVKKYVNCEKVGEGREGWRRLEEVGEGWRRLEKVGEGWRRLEKVGEG